MHCIRKARPPHSSGRRAAARARSSEGPAGRSGGAGRGAGLARRPRASARPADRASAPAAGPFRLPARAPHGGARRGDAARLGRGLRGRLVLRPFRHRHGRRAPAAAADRAGMRQPQLRARRRAGTARRSAEPARRPGAGRARAVHGRLPPRAGRGDRPRAARARDTSPRSPLRSRPARRTRRSPPISVSTPIAPMAATACCNPVSPASASPRS